jgi:hypothetical protein
MCQERIQDNNHKTYSNKHKNEYGNIKEGYNGVYEQKQDDEHKTCETRHKMMIGKYREKVTRSDELTNLQEVKYSMHMATLVISNNPNRMKWNYNKGTGTGDTTRKEHIEYRWSIHSTMRTGSSQILDCRTYIPARSNRWLHSGPLEENNKLKTESMNNERRYDNMPETQHTEWNEKKQDRQDRNDE